MISVEELMKEPDDTPSAEEFDNLFIGLTDLVKNARKRGQKSLALSGGFGRSINIKPSWVMPNGMTVKSYLESLGYKVNEMSIYTFLEW